MFNALTSVNSTTGLLCSAAAVALHSRRWRRRGKAAEGRRGNEGKERGEGEFEVRLFRGEEEYEEEEEGRKGQIGSWQAIPQRVVYVQTAITAFSLQDTLRATVRTERNYSGFFCFVRPILRDV